MKWTIVGGEVILRLRVAVLSGVWEAVYREYLRHQPILGATSRAASVTTDENAA